MHFLNKMERKFGRFAIQGLMKYIILFYVAGYLIEFLAPQAYSFLTLEPYLIFHYGQVWRLVSWVLIPQPTGNFFFAIIMIILYYQLGTALERTWGAFKFNVYIFGGMIFTVLGALLLYVIHGRQLQHILYQYDNFPRICDVLSGYADYAVFYHSDQDEVDGRYLCGIDHL